MYLFIKHTVNVLQNSERHDNVYINDDYLLPRILCLQANNIVYIIFYYFKCIF